MVRLIELACPPVGRRETDEYWTLWVELWSRALRNDEAARKREALERRWRNTIAEVVREGQRSGEFGPVDPERFATYLSALMDGLALQVLFHDSAVDGELVNEMCLDAAARELGFDPDASGRRGEERAPGRRSSRPRARDGAVWPDALKGGLIEMAFHPRERSPWRRRMSRREALRLMAGTAAAGGLLAGCGSGAGSSSASRVVIGTREDPVKQPLFDDNPMIESGLEPEKGPLRLYNWADYIYTRVLKDFEEEFGVEVELTTFYNLEEATRKLRTGKVDFDVFVPTAEIIPKFVAGKLLQPLNHDYLPNLKKNVWPMLADPYYDRGSRYTVPYTVYLTGIGWRTDMVSADIAAMDNPWEAFWDPEYKGIAGLYDDYRETIGVGMYRDGITDINGAQPGRPRRPPRTTSSSSRTW